MRLKQLVAVFCILAIPFQAVRADIISQIQGEVQNDANLLSGWFTDQLKLAVPYNGTSGDVLPGQLKLFGFEVGVEGVVSDTRVDVNGLKDLPTQLVDTSKISTFSRLPMPSVLGHANIGLPFGLEGGIRVGGIPSESFNNGTTDTKIKNSIVGFDVRKKLIEDGITRPFGLTIGANYTHISGSFDVTTPINEKESLTEGSETATLDGATGSGHSQWDVNSFGVQAILNKKILFMNPYIGASANRNTGSLSTNLTTTGNVDVTQNGNPIGTQALPVIIGTGSSSPNSWDNRLLAGIEFTFLPFMRLGIGGEYAGSKNMTGDLGLRIQFR